MKTLLVGGRFDEYSGSVSSVIAKIANYIKPDEYYNGGNINEIETILNSVKDFDIVYWLLDTTNEIPKMRDVKKISPKCILITSKRNDNSKYCFMELISRALDSKSNLCIEMSKCEVENKFKFMLFDPLGVSWYSGYSIDELCKIMNERVLFLSKITRVKSVCAGDDRSFDKTNSEFYEVVKESAKTFHNLINANTTRFLGNSSFRCQKGFPSCRLKGTYYVSKRNINKEFIDEDGFVETFLDDNDVLNYFGNHKPSVDTPIQLRLYRAYPNINYMIHSHCYIENAVFTETSIPCGGLEEVEEIRKALPNLFENFYTINLKGHGSIVMANTVEQLKEIKYIKRNMPEVL